jgi:hypothetical protein
MFENIGNAAERLATNVSESRRGFLGRLGKAALGVAGVLGASTFCHAYPPPRGGAGYAICSYQCPDGTKTGRKVANCGSCFKTVTSGGQNCPLLKCWAYAD